MPTRTLELHSIPAETLREYLTRLGGILQPGGEIAGPGWVARITRLPDYRLGQAAFCCYQVEMTGEADALREVWPRFELRVLRPGG